ncbi:MAG: TIGR04500 family putative peptide maturation system protein [Candidatus Rokuibacteriota bacterium]
MPGPTPTRSLNAALAAAAELLPRLPSEDTRRRETKALLQRLVERWPELGIDVVAVPDPARRTVEYDVLLDHPNGGTLALSYSADSGLPWTARFAEKWAAYKLATVNDVSVLLQDGLLALKVRGREQELFESMISAELLRQAVEREGLALDDHELQQAMDEFRAARGLHFAESTFKWLEEHGLTQQELESLVESMTLGQKLKERVVSDKAERYFAEHRTRFDRALLVRVTTAGRHRAEEMMAAAGNDLLACALEMLLRSRAVAVEAQVLVIRRDQLPPDEARVLFAAQAGEIVGPCPVAGPMGIETGYTVFQVLEFQPALQDVATRRAVEDAIFGEWLDEQRREARVTWHLK